MSREILSFIAGTIPLDVLLLIALVLTITHGAGPADRRVRLRLIGLVTLAIVVQCGHFAEEWATGFYTRFPEFLGLYPWSVALWASFNIFWIAVWVVCLVGLLWRSRFALFPVWFLGLGCAINGIAHPLLALAVGGYFPGLWTSPVAGIMGAILLPRLARFTGPPDTRADRSAVGRQLR